MRFVAGLGRRSGRDTAGRGAVAERHREDVAGRGAVLRCCWPGCSGERLHCGRDTAARETHREEDVSGGRRGRAATGRGTDVDWQTVEGPALATMASAEMPAPKR